MPNHKKLIEFDGRFMSVGEWAAELGMKRATLASRLYNGIPIDEALNPISRNPVPSGRFYKNSGERPTHRVIAEKALGRAFRHPEEVHHADVDHMNNDPSNLVICPDRAYHKLLHMRTRAYDACGDANARKCTYCKGWDSLTNLVVTKQNHVYHRACYNDYNSTYRTKRISK